MPKIAIAAQFLAPFLLFQNAMSFQNGSIFLTSKK